MNKSANDIFNNYFPQRNYNIAKQIAPGNIQKDYNQKLLQCYYNFKAKGNIGVEQFSDEIKKLLGLAWGEDWGTFTMEYPTGNNVDNVNLPIISFGVISRVNSTNFKGPKHRIFESFEDPEDNNYTLIISRKWYDCDIEFMFYEKTNKDVRKLMTSFEMLFESYMGYFKELGVTNIVFSGETDSRLSKGYKQDLPSTRLVYSMLLESIHIERVRTTKNLDTTVSTVQL